MHKVRISELDTWLRCKLLWKYQYLDQWEKITDPEEHSPRLSGSAIHKGVEAMLISEKNQRQIGTEALDSYLALYEGGQKYRAGGITALMGVPDELLGRADLVVEDEVEVSYPYLVGAGEHSAAPKVPVTVYGHPDLWFHADGGITVVDFKSTSKDEWQKLSWYQTWNLQPRYYAVLLHDWLKERGVIPPPFYTQHIILSTRGKHAAGTELLILPSEMDEARARMLYIAGQIAHAAEHETIGFKDAFFSSLCQSCDFAPVDEILLTGGQVDSVFAERYTKREV